MLAQAEAAFGQMNVSRETLDKLIRYAELLEKWNPAINLVSKSTLSTLWSRHMLDSAQVFALLPQGARHWADLGSGGGFPGLVIAILAAETAPNLQVTLVESDRRKATFLSTVLRETGVTARVLAERIEAVPPLAADVLSARALAALPQLLAFAEMHLAGTGIAVFPKGSAWKTELDEARKIWSFALEEQPSVTDPEAVILKIQGVSRV
ncbi:16S rRNA (guanine(527)-N(7))-methyltransferase RsmG [Phaeovulum sp. W22_SRMD_FR3]|uniref:16S rRNA (guanine(527)-N(7))-methyltransferase RsmG n=1 Tax=Phaeovulum sp. W22_SRMD_FR3 TaxID=3240274 RepID=UPI003F9BA7F8